MPHSGERKSPIISFECIDSIDLMRYISMQHMMRFIAGYLLVPDRAASRRPYLVVHIPVAFAPDTPRYRSRAMTTSPQSPIVYDYSTHTFAAQASAVPN
jgi:hypothetical protein